MYRGGDMDAAAEVKQQLGLTHHKVLAQAHAQLRDEHNKGAKHRPQAQT